MHGSAASAKAQAINRIGELRFGRESGAPNATGCRAQCSVAGCGRSCRVEIRLSVVIVARFEWDCAW